MVPFVTPAFTVFEKTRVHSPLTSDIMNLSALITDFGYHHFQGDSNV